MKKKFKMENLDCSGHSVLEACISCGFTDYTSFLKAFKKNYEITPSNPERIRRIADDLNLPAEIKAVFFGRKAPDDLFQIFQENMEYQPLIPFCLFRDQSVMQKLRRG